MEQRYALGLAGSFLLILGVFCPLVSIPIVGAQNYFQNGQGDGVLVLALAVIALLLTFSRRYQLVPFIGAAALVVIGVTFVALQSRLSDAKASMQTELAGNPFRGFADAAMSSVQMQWGWAVLAIGAVLLMATAAKPKATPPAPAVSP